MSQGKPLPTPEQVEQMRQKLLADPNTKRLADAVSMGFEEYVELVMKFAADPNLEPELTVMPDEDLTAMGQPPPDIHAMASLIEEHGDAQEITNRSKFADASNSQRERVSGKIPLAPVATVKADEVRQDLKVELERARTSGKHNKV